MSAALDSMRAAGIPVTWDVVRVGWDGPGTLGRQLSLADIRAHADEVIADSRASDVASIAMLSTAGRDDEVSEHLDRLGQHSSAGERAWRAHLLARLLDRLPESPVDALADLTSFWSAFGFPPEAPHVVQGRGNTLSPAEYYTRELKDRMLAAHRAWLAAELRALRAGG